MDIGPGDLVQYVGCPLYAVRRSPTRPAPGAIYTVREVVMGRARDGSVRPGIRLDEIRATGSDTGDGIWDLSMFRPVRRRPSDQFMTLLMEPRHDLQEEGVTA